MLATKRRQDMRFHQIRERKNGLLLVWKGKYRLQRLGVFRASEWFPPHGPVTKGTYRKTEVVGRFLDCIGRLLSKISHDQLCSPLHEMPITPILDELQLLIFHFTQILRHQPRFLGQHLDEASQPVLTPCLHLGPGTRTRSLTRPGRFPASRTPTPSPAHTT